ncbi:MAG: hypothetical protein ACXAC5_04865 [Promethearchaeota archaeon]|jgi:hypothetical protein
MKTTKFLFSLIVATLINCGTEPPENPPPEKPYCVEFVNGICVHIPPRSEHSFCTYYLGGSICVIEDDRFMEIDLDMLVWSIFITEEHVNTFYPGLNIFELAEQEGLKLHYKRAGTNQYKGTYSDRETKARVWLRSGNGITRRMECMDRYEVAMHEILHFLDSRYIMSETDDPHMVPHLFWPWEHQQAYIEGRDPEQSNYAMGLIYYDISNECGYDE